jgi:hypothetical protein
MTVDNKKPQQQLKAQFTSFKRKIIYYIQHSAHTYIALPCLHNSAGALSPTVLSLRRTLP